MQRKKEIPKTPRFDYVTSKAYELLFEWGLTSFPITAEQILELVLIPQNSKRRSESQKSLNPAITSSESKAEFTSVNSEMTGNKDKIINYCTNPAAFDSTVTNGHIIFLH